MHINLLPGARTAELPNEFPNVRPKEMLRNLLEPLERAAAGSVHLISNQKATFSCGGEDFVLPRYLFVGPRGGGEQLRIGLFAGVHGDEPEGIRALVRFLGTLDREPQLATGYNLFAYPVCNPTGVEDGTRRSRNGKDLNREFWRQSEEPEVRLLQSELVSHAFDGIISLHTDDTSHGFYGFAHGATITENLIIPALQAAAEFLPLNHNPRIDGFNAVSAIIRDTYEGVLRAPPNVHPQPFEIILETPQAAPEHLKEAALTAGLRSILSHYREFIAFAPNL